ncbi:MAG: GxxExxY protein [Aridibacter sp.]
MKEIVYKEESYKIIGACFEVYKRQGFGFTEPIYQECLAIEFELQGIPFVDQPEIQLEYKGRKLKQFFKPDFICYDKIIVEIKALSDLIETNKSQTLNYLNATKFELALLVNFGHYPKLEYKRIANNQAKSSIENIRSELNSWTEKKNGFNKKIF